MTPKYGKISVIISLRDIIKSNISLKKIMYNSELPFILTLIKKDEILLRNPLELLLYDHELILDENKIRGDNDHKHL